MNQRTKRFAISAILLTRQLPNGEEFKIIRNQIIRSATSVGANYRASNRAKSTADFINKRKIVEEECDETMYWLELVVELEPTLRDISRQIWLEGNELLAIIVASIISTKKKDDRN